MFAQALITIILTWALAEVSCRVFLNMTPVQAIKEIFGPPTDPRFEGNEDLYELLQTRREELRVTRVRLRLTAKATGVTENLERTEQELRELEARLTELERQRTQVVEPS